MRRPHRIIVEGMDGAGKTTLINELLKRHPDMYFVPGLGANADYNTVIPQMLDEEDDGLIPVHDRFFYSELVYGPIVRGSLLINDQLLQTVSWMLRQTAFLIYARPNKEILHQKLHEGKHMEGVIEKEEDLIQFYDQIMSIEKSWFGPRFFHYSWHREGDMDQLEATLYGYLR